MQDENFPIIKEIKVKNVITKSALPGGGFSVNPYVGCTHGCRYCYASFMKRFTNHNEPWGKFLDVKYWPTITNPQKYSNAPIIIGSVTDGYNPQEEKYQRTRQFLKEMLHSDAKITICTKSDLVLRDLDILTKMKNISISFSINTLDDDFRSDMDNAVSIERRLQAMQKIYEMGIRTVCFISPIFPGITDIIAIVERVKNICDFVWLENLNLRGAFNPPILHYIQEKYPHLMNLYDDIYNHKDNTYWFELDKEISHYALENQLQYIDNYMPDGRNEKGRPTLVNYFFHEQVRGSNNTGARKVSK